MYELLKAFIENSLKYIDVDVKTYEFNEQDISICYTANGDRDFKIYMTISILTLLAFTWNNKNN